ncbi:unnamed protein product [Meganyctiphanes norvegica]|uniref:Condensation domain-containing protein n=1 Tax=Meganyctiphanes norvegica TaxID=48144 RepID=A0AAV2PU76_MEGNR
MEIFTPINFNYWDQNQSVYDVLELKDFSHKAMTPGPSKSANGNKWVRPLGYVERLMVGAHDNDNMVSLYALWVESNKPLDLSLIRHAASILKIKMPNLQMSIGHQNNELWWKELESEILNVEQIVTDNFTDTFECLLKKKFSIEKEPLWFIRLIDLKENKYEHGSINEKQVCMFGFHHSITDGTTNMKICTVFLDILNNLVLNRPIDMKEEGIFARPHHDRIANEYMSSLALNTLLITRVWKAIFCYGANVSPLTRLYPQPSHMEASTKVIYDELDEITTSQLIQRCKKENVTLNSAFTAAANLGIFNLIKAKDQSTKEIKIHSSHRVNMRRFWPKELQTSSFGCHMSAMDLTCNTNDQNQNNFWKYTREVHSVINTNLNETKYCLQVVPISHRQNFAFFWNSWLSWFGLPSTNDIHFSITNMGNLSNTFPGEGPEVRVSKIMRTTSGHYLPSLCCHSIQTFQGKFSLSIDHYTQKMKKETVESYAKNIFSILRRAIDESN